MIQTRSVHSAIEPRDGLRILVARFRGRGLPKNRYDVWMASLGPSEALLRSFQQGSVSWAEFKKRYKAELFTSDALDRRNQSIQNHGQKFTLRLLQELGKRQTLTLLCHCAEDETQCHRHVLQQILQAKI